MGLNREICFCYTCRDITLGEIRSGAIPFSVQLLKEADLWTHDGEAKMLRAKIIQAVFEGKLDRWKA